MTLEDLMVYDEDIDTTESEDKSLVFDNKETEDFLKNRFKNKECIGKKDMFLYENRKTLLGNKIKSSDKILLVDRLNAEDAPHTRFMSITPSIITYREIKDVSKQYVYVNPDRRDPLLVLRKYMELPKYNEHKNRINDEFLR